MIFGLKVQNLYFLWKRINLIMINLSSHYLTYLFFMSVFQYLSLIFTNFYFIIKNMLKICFKFSFFSLQIE